MKKLSVQLLAETVTNKRKAKDLTQAQLSELTGINRSLIGRIENLDYLPMTNQLESLAEALDFDVTELFVEEKAETQKATPKSYKIAVAGTGYVGLSLAVVLAQHNQVTAVDIVQEKVDMINNKKSPIQDDFSRKRVEFNCYFRRRKSLR